MALLGIDNDKLNDIKNQVKRNYPLECCGLLIGTNASERKVVEVRQVENKNTERTHDRYEIESKEFMKVDKEAKRKVSKSSVSTTHIQTIPLFLRHLIRSMHGQGILI